MAEILVGGADRSMLKTDSAKVASEKLLNPSEYTTRAEALVEARRLIGGIEIEKV